MSEYVTCRVCHHRYTGFIPKGGDGSALRPRKHYRRIPRSTNMGLTYQSTREVCPGSYRVVLQESG